MTKRIFAISTLVLVLLVGAIFVYNFAFKKTTEKTATGNANNEGKTTNTQSSTNTESTTGPISSADKQSANQAISAISTDSVFGATLAPDGNSLYFFSGANGQVDQVDFNGELQKVISTQEFQNIQNVFWSKTKNKAVVKRADGANRSKYLLLDLAQKSVVPLKSNIDSIAWSSLGDKIIYKYFDSKTKTRTLNIADPNGSNWRRVAETDYVSVQISSIPGASDISFWPTPSAFSSSIVSTVNFSGENRKEILKDRFGVDLLWSPDGKNAAVSSSDQRGGHKTDLALMNSDGGQFHSLNFPTFSKKCAWSADSTFLFCALPGNIPEDAVLPNDWQGGKVQTADTFWKIEIATGKKERLVDPQKINGSFDALNPFLSQDKKNLFFTNKADGKLYKLEF